MNMGMPGQLTQQMTAAGPTGGPVTGAESGGKINDIMALIVINNTLYPPYIIEIVH